MIQILPGFTISTVDCKEDLKSWNDSSFDELNLDSIFKKVPYALYDRKI